VNRADLGRPVHLSACYFVDDQPDADLLSDLRKPSEDK
jgi:hypothetical protein